MFVPVLGAQVHQRAVDVCPRLLRLWQEGMENGHVQKFRDGQQGLQRQCSSWPALEG